MNTTSTIKRNAAIEWARDVLANKDQYVIFDTETTGLNDDDLIIHIGIMDLDGNMLVDTPVKPLSKRRISAEAKYLHGYGLKDLKNAPLLVDIIPKIKEIAETRTFLSYNAQFHIPMLEQSILNEGILVDLEIKGKDVKVHYIDFSDRYNPPLPNRKNTGIGDCTATLDLIKIMATAELETKQSVPKANVKSRSKYGWCGVVILIWLGLWALSAILTLILN